jgi:chromosome segregation protein
LTAEETRLYLKALELQGFKSFAEKTVLTFGKNITGVVGPNGAGKSNLSDAILWVMGEQRTRTLRGTKMEDVIFGGTEKRNPLGYAQVTLVLDNTDGSLPIEAPEVQLSRRYYRSGESEYFINRRQVRLRDVDDLLMDTGLGRDGYSVIGQGKIAEIISDRPMERRGVFEEAAGISRYRYRKEDAERKLGKTEENLLRINDKIEELEMQVGPLREQAEVARKYLALRAELKEQEVSVWMASLDHLHENAEKLRLAYEQAVENRNRAQQEVKTLYAASDNLLERMHQKDLDAEQARKRYEDLQQEISRAEAAEAVTRNQQKNCDESIARLQEEDRNSQQRLDGLRAQIQEQEKQAREHGRAAEEFAEKLQSAANVIAGQKMKRDRCEETLQGLRQKKSAAAMDQRSAEDRIHLLEDMEKEYQGYSNAVRAVMLASNGQRLRGICGPVADLIRADDRYATAIETALGAALQNIVVETQRDAQSAIEMLKRKKTGRCTFLPVDVMDGRVLRDEDFTDPGCLGIAFNLAQFEPRYRGVFANLLGRTLVAESLSDAIRISNAEHHAVRIVTLDGQMIHAGGSMTGGSSIKGTGFLTRANELKRLREELARLNEEAEALEEKVSVARTEFVNAENALNNAQADRQGLEKEQTVLKAQQQSDERTAGQLKALLEAMSADASEKSRSIAAQRAQKEALGETLRTQQEQTQKLRQKLEKIAGEIKAITDSRMELEGKRSRSDKQAQQANADLMDLERTVSRCEQKKEQADLEEKQILDKLWDTYELSHSAAEEIRRPVSSLAKANREIAGIRREIAALGTPNLGAIDEFKRVNERYTFLTDQRDDITKSRRELQGIIGDITREMEKIFAEEFEKVRAAFQRIFVELFGGGRADLSLEDPEHVLDCGIDIRVQPPGKSLKNLSLLSGGEMAYVAIALYFAILCVRPTPFCVMDEIEAALDEANVIRFAKYLQKMSSSTQFIVITHRRGTMEAANHLYGVTMQEKGVSKVLSLDLEEAENEIKK